MDNKQIRIEPMIEPKTSPKMERMIKQYGVMWQKATQFGDLSKGNKELEKRLKYMGQWVTKDKELAKVMSQNSNKALENQKTTLQMIGREVDKNLVRYKNAETTAARWAARATRSATARYGDLGGVPDFVSRNIAAGQAGMTGRIQGLAAGNAMSGSEILMQQAKDEEQQRAGERRMKMWQMGVWGQAAAGVVGGLSNMYFGYGMRSLGYQAQERGMSDKLYGEITSGDYSSVLMMAKHRDKIKDLATNQQQATLWGLGAQAAGGVFQTATSIASGGLANNPGGIAGGPMSVAAAGLDYWAGKDKADAVSAAVQGIDYLKALDPVQMRQFRELTGRAKSVQEMGMLSGGVGVGATRDLIRAGQSGGLTLDQTMPYFDALRSGIGHGQAQGLAGFAARSVGDYGVDRSAMTQSLIGFAGSAAGAGGASDAALRTLARAVSVGITDSKLKEVLITTIPAMVNSGIVSRGGDPNQMVATITQSAAMMAASGGRGVDAKDLQIATSGFDFQNKLLGGGGGISPINVARQAGVMRLGSEMGISKQGRIALASLSAADVAGIVIGDKSNLLYKMFSEEEDMSDEKIAQLKESFGKIGANAYDTSMAGWAGHSIAGQVAVSGATGTQLDVVSSGMSQARMPTAGRIGLIGKTRTSADQQALNDQRVSDAANLMHPLMTALSDPKMIEGLRNATMAATFLADNLNSFERSGFAGLNALPTILDSVSASVNLLSTIATTLVGNLSAYGLTVGTVPPTPQALSSHSSTGGPPNARSVNAPRQQGTNPAFAPSAANGNTVSSH
jgi:hypothetical protein